MTVDVLIPTYAPNPAHLKEALESLLAQTFTEWRCFIHDDPTDTDTKEMIEEYLSDPRITFKRGDEPHGIGQNWNACLHATNGDIVAYLFQDDTWAPTYLEKAVHILTENPDIGLVSMGHHYQIEGDIVTENEYTDLEALRTTIDAGRHSGSEYLMQWISMGLRPNIIGEPDFTVLRRSTMASAGDFHPTMRQSLDAEYWVRLLEHTDWYYLKEDLGAFRVHLNATTSKNRQSGQGLFDRFHILQQFIDRTPKGPLRKAAEKAQVFQFQDMASKYMEKRDRGDKITTKGSGILKRFCMRHPIVAARTVVKVFTGY